jgi:photosystem II stability/assembly factor-like uncharacterized protein
MSRRIYFVSLAALLTTLPASAVTAPRWTHVGPDGGKVCALAASPSRPAVVYAGVTPGGVYRSADNGATWTFAGTGLGPDSSACHLAVDPVRPNVVWAGTGTGLFKSENSGTSWVLRGPSFHGFKAIAAVAVDPKHPSTILAALQVYSPLFRSQDGGATWTAAGPRTQGTSILLFDPHPSGTVYAVAGGLLKSRDSGASWSLLTGLPPVQPISALAVDPKDSRTLYLSGLGGFFRSANSGVSWTKVQSLGAVPITGLALAPGSKPSAPSTLYIATSTQGVLISTNGGTTSRPSGPGLPDTFVNTVITTPAAVLAGDGSAGVFTSRNRGASWQTGRGLAATDVSSLAASSETPSRIYAETRPTGVYASNNNGNTWMALGPATPGFYLESPAVAVAPSDPHSIYLATAEGFYRRLNNAPQWTSLPWDSCAGPLRLAVDPSDAATLVLSGVFTGTGCSRRPGACLLFKTTDAGSSWSCIGTGLPNGLGPSFFLGFDPLAPQHLYAPDHDGLYRSTDGGGHWSLLAPGILPASLAFSPIQAGLLYSALPNGVGRSTDGGATWQIHNTGLPTTDWMIYVAVDPEVPSIVYAATTTHVFRSADGGVTWKPLSNGLGDVTLSSLVIDPSSTNVLYIGTNGGGVMRLQQ